MIMIVWHRGFNPDHSFHVKEMQQCCIRLQLKAAWIECWLPEQDQLLIKFAKRHLKTMQFIEMAGLYCIDSLLVYRERRKKSIPPIETSSFAIYSQQLSFQLSFGKGL